MNSDDISRIVAQKLVPEFGKNLPALVENQLHGGHNPPANYELATTIAIASLIVSMAQFSYDLYKDNKEGEKRKLSNDDMARNIRINICIDNNITEEQRDKIISAVVDEIYKKNI